MRIWARAIYVLRKIRPLLARREAPKQPAWAREVLFSVQVQVRFEMPNIASCSRAAAPQCAPLRGYTSVHFREFRFFWGSGTQSEAWGSCGPVATCTEEAEWRPEISCSS